MICFSRKKSELNDSSCNYLKIFIAVLLFFILLRPTCVFAFNSDYLDKVKWVNSDKVVSERINAECAFGKANGIFNYINDPSEYSIYFYLSINENTITEDEQDISLDFQITNTNDQYYFSVDQNGATDFIGDAEYFFYVESNFNTYPATKSGDYIVAVDIDNGCDYNLISMHLNVNGHRYSIFRDLAVSAPAIVTSNSVKPTKVKDTTTKKVKTEKNSSESKTSKASTEKSTKFSNSNRVLTGENNSIYNSAQIVTDNDESENYDDIAPVEEKSEKMTASSLSLQSKLFLVFAAIIGIAGISIMLAAVIKRKDKPAEKEETDVDSDDNFNF